MPSEFEAPIKFYGAHFEPQPRINFEPIFPQINFAEEIQIHLPKKTN